MNNNEYENIYNSEGSYNTSEGLYGDSDNAEKNAYAPANSESTEQTYLQNGQSYNDIENAQHEAKTLDDLQTDDEIYGSRQRGGEIYSSTQQNSAEQPTAVNAYHYERQTSSPVNTNAFNQHSTQQVHSYTPYPYNANAQTQYGAPHSSPYNPSYTQQARTAQPNTSAQPARVMQPNVSAQPTIPTQQKSASQAKQAANLKKKKRTVSFGALIASVLVTALLCSILTTSIGYLAVRKNLASANAAQSTDTSAKQPTATTNITVTGETEGIVSAVAEKCGPSVVGIRVTTTSSNYYMFGAGGATSEGSGVIYSSDGYIITNYHVISSAVQQSTGSNNYYNYYFGFGGQQQPTSSVVEVYLPDDSETAISAQIIGYDVTSDLAVLKIEKTGLPAMEIADSDDIKIGDRAIAIGNPGGLEFMGSVSAGIISGLDRTLSTENGTEMNLIQTDAAINPGNSGGALVNSEGKLIGINNSKIAGDGFEGMGFSIPSNTVIEICDRLIRQENEPSAYLGVTIDTSYSASVLQRYGYPVGVVVFSVAEDSPAEEAGIKQYDIITAINGTEITSYEQLNSEKNRYSPGETIVVTIYRNGSSYDVNVTLGGNIQ